MDADFASPFSLSLTFPKATDEETEYIREIVIEKFRASSSQKVNSAASTTKE